MAGLGGQPILILREGSQRTHGRDAQSMNIMAGKVIADAVRTTLGPRGMDKMLVDGLGDVVITNDGVTILKKMDIAHPAAKMIVEVAKTQEDEVGDGTTSAVVLTGELLKKAEDLLEQEVHPTIIASGYRLAAQKAHEILEDYSTEVDKDDESQLLKVALTAMTGKGAEAAKDKLAGLVVRAVKAIEDNGETDLDNIKIEKKVGGSIEDSELIEGVIIDKERLHPSMPRKVEDAKIALINSAIELKDTEVDAEISITSPEQLQAFLDEEERMLKAMVDKIVASGANVVFTQKGVDDMAQHFLAKAGVFAVRRLKKSDMENLSRATGAAIVSSIDELSKEDLGHAGLVEEKKVSGDDMIFVTQSDNPKSVSIILKGGTEHVVDEVERAVEDAMHVVSVVIQDGKIVAGGGAPEIELALRLRQYAATVGGREQLAVNAFADAAEVIPRTLAENAGLDPIDTLVNLRAHHEKGEKNAGLDVFTGDVVDMFEADVVEPLRVKIQAVNSAAEATNMILRIDDILAAGGLSKPSMPGGEEDFEGGMDGF